LVAVKRRRKAMVWQRRVYGFGHCPLQDRDQLRNFALL